MGWYLISLHFLQSLIVSSTVSAIFQATKSMAPHRTDLQAAELKALRSRLDQGGTDEAERMLQEFTVPRQRVLGRFGLD